MKSLADYQGGVIAGLHIKVIVFHDYYVDEQCAYEESSFFSLPEESLPFHSFVSGIRAGGGVDESEIGL